MQDVKGGEIKLVKNILPTPFTIAVLLTISTLILAIFSSQSQNDKIDLIKILNSWEKGIWNPSLLVFAIQMMLMLVLGHILALTKPIERIINKSLIFCTNTANAAAIITFLTLLVSLFNWGLGLIFGAVFARKTAEYATEKKIKLNYPLIGAAGYSGLMIWHGGISGSAPIKIAEEKHFLYDKIGVISQSETIFSEMNISVNLFVLIILPLIMYLLGKKNQGERINITRNSYKKKTNISGAEKLDHSKILSSLFGLTILIFTFYKAFIVPSNISLSVLTPNYINLVLFGLCITLHGNFYNFLQALNSAISGVSGILIQFPLYFGIMGVMNESGMINIISDFFVNISNTLTFPIFTFFSAGIVNIFIPSGGGQWVIQGPIIIDTAIQLGVSIPKAIMSLAYGDQITNMLQPFWALPLLGITGLKAKDLLPYTVIIMIVGTLIFISGLLIF